MSADKEQAKLPPDLSASPAEDKPTRKRPPALMIGGLVLVMGIIVWKIGGAGKQAVQEVQEAPPEKKAAVEMQTLSESAINTQRQVEMDRMKERMALLEDQLRKQPTVFAEQLGAVENKLTRDIQGVARVISESSEERVRQQRLGGPTPALPGPLSGGVTNVTLPSTGGEFATEVGKEEEFPYRRLGGASLVQANNLVSGLPTIAPPAPSQAASPPNALPAMAALDGGGTDAGEVAKPKKPSKAGESEIEGPSITLPAYSYADLRTLHGVTCPVRTSATGSLGLSDKPAPVTLPVVGPFRGPQGVEYQTGSIHLFGFCEGMDRLRPTGMIKVEGLSLVRADGSNFTVQINGYVIDARDNDLGVRGTKESVKGEQLALSMGASGVAAVGDVFKQSAFDQVETQGGNIRQILQKGNIGDAIGGALIADSAKELARFFRQYADTLFDVIAIPGGTPLKLIIEQPIQIPVDETGVSETSDGRPLL